MKATTEISPNEARAIAQDAWIFGMPLVYIETQIDTGTHVSKTDKTHAPINQLIHYREFPDASNKTVVGLNVDTLYSLANLDLSQGPLALSVPGNGSPLLGDAAHRRLEQCPACAGIPRTAGGKGGNFAIVGPD